MANLSFPSGILNPNAQQQLPLSMGQQPALANGPMPQQPALQGATGNARQSARMPMIPNNKIVMGKEGLLRIGGAMMDGALDGRGFSAGIQEYGNIMDYNRAQDMERYQEEEARRLEEQRRQDLMRKMSGKPSDKKDEPTDKEKLEGAAEIARLEGIMQDLQTMNLTGPWAGGFGNKLDGSGVMGEEAAKKTAKRKILAELQVNATLAFTAQTKGAITDREMALFQTPVPKLTEDETVWIEWLKPQLEILKQLQQNGITDEAAKQQGLPTSNSSPSGDVSVDDLVNQYDPQN